MIVDEITHIRELGFRRIIKARKLSSKLKLVRSFQPPKLNFKAEEYTQMIDWATTKLSPPPLLRRVADDEIWMKMSSGDCAEELELWQISLSHSSGGAMRQVGHRSVSTGCRP